TFELFFSTYFGGSATDEGDVLFQLGPDVYFTGSTASTDLPAQGEGLLHSVFQKDQPGTDAFVAKMDVNALFSVNSLKYSTYLGGNGTDSGTGITVDDLGQAIVTGQTTSTNFPLKRQVRTVNQVSEAFVTQLNDSGSDVLLSTYLGGD